MRPMSSRMAAETIEAITANQLLGAGSRLQDFGHDVAGMERWELEAYFLCFLDGSIPVEDSERKEVFIALSLH